MPVNGRDECKICIPSLDSSYSPSNASAFMGRGGALPLLFEGGVSHHAWSFSAVSGGGTSSPRSSNVPDSLPTVAFFHSSRYTGGLYMPCPGCILLRARYTMLETRWLCWVN